MKSLKVTFKVEQNKIFGDFRVVKYVNGEWYNERDNNWNKIQAEKKCREYKRMIKENMKTMSDDI